MFVYADKIPFVSIRIEDKPRTFDILLITGLQGHVVGQLRVTSKVLLCAESESSYKIGPSRQDIEPKNDFLDYI